MTNRKPADLAVTRPAAYHDPNTEHPDQNGPILGPPPAKYTLAVKDRICQLIEEGQRPRTAAAMAGISAETFDRWMREGRNGHPHLWEFAQAVERSVAVSEGAAVAVLAAKGSFGADPDNAKWFLERRFAESYSKEAATKVNAMLEDFFKRLEAALPPEIFQMVIAAAAGQALPTSATTASALLDSGSEKETQSVEPAG